MGTLVDAFERIVRDFKYTRRDLEEDNEVWIEVFSEEYENDSLLFVFRYDRLMEVH